MNANLLRAILLGAACAVAASAGSAEGKAVFTGKCQGCHGPSGEGKESVAKMFKTTMQPLGSKEVQAKSDADLKKVVTTGQGKMKPIAGLSDAEVGDVVAYVRTLKK